MCLDDSLQARSSKNFQRSSGSPQSQCKQLCGWPKNKDRQTERARASPRHAHAGVLTSVGRWGESNGQVKGKWDGALVDGNKLHILLASSITHSLNCHNHAWVDHTHDGWIRNTPRGIAIADVVDLE
jgi:hypothetical protein